MIIDVTQPVIGYDGEPLELPAQKPGDEVEQLILKKALCDSLMGSFRGEEDKVTGSEKMKRFELARKINRCLGEFTFSMEDLELCKTMVAKMYATVVSGAVWAHLTEESKAV